MLTFPNLLREMCCIRICLQAITFTCMHLVDTFIQSDLQCIRAIHLFCQYVKPCYIVQCFLQDFVRLVAAGDVTLICIGMTLLRQVCFQTSFGTSDLFYSMNCHILQYN